MWTSWRAGPRDQLGLLPILDLPDPEPELRGSDERRRIRSRRGTPSTFASWAAFSARPSTAVRSG